MKLSIIIPVYNEAQSLPLLAERLRQVSGRISSEKGYDVGYIFVDDGSSDDSVSLLKTLDFAGCPARLLSFSRNFGKEAALSAGIDAATDADLVIMMDADLQHPPELVMDLLNKWEEEGVDCVYFYKDCRRESEGFLKTAFAKSFYWIINRHARFQITENAGDYRLITRRFADALISLPETERFMKGLYGWVGFEQYGIPLAPPPREHGRTNFNFMQLLLMSFDAITSFTTTPLRLMALFGMGVAGASTLYGIYIILERLTGGQEEAGLTSTLTLIAFFGGLQMIYLGLVGEYIGKAVLEAKRRPGYILAENRILQPQTVCEDHPPTKNETAPSEEA